MFSVSKSKRKSVLMLKVQYGRVHLYPMPNEPEPRVDVNLPIRVFGMDAEGRPFSQKAHAQNISQHGARLAGLEKQLKPGDVIGVQFGDQKTRCKVIWVVDAGPVQKIEAWR